MRAFPIVALACCLAATCALLSRPQRLADGSYQLKCNAKLSVCLGEIEDICNWHGYDVIRATEDRQRNDIREVRDEIVTSEAIVRCRQGKALFGSTPDPPQASPPPPFPPPRAAPATADAGAVPKPPETAPPRDAGSQS